MKPEIIRVRYKGQITVPLKIRKALDIEDGDYVACEAKEDYLILRKIPAYKRASFDDGIWNLIGSAEDKEGKTDVSSNKHKYLGEKV